MNKFSFNIMIVGVGGQGVMTLGKFFREMALKSSQIHGLVSMESRGVSQREGSVFCLVRYNLDPSKTIPFLSPSPPIQEIDLMVALEPLELLRNLQYLRPNGITLVNNHELIPKSSLSQDIKSYPDINERLNQFKQDFPDHLIIEKDFTNMAIQENKPAIYANYLILAHKPSLFTQILPVTNFSELLQDFFNHV
ncbi:hypothetical protein NEF87_004745 [Candidatus Lokiarchaeum ossiferum]|uniref:Pyruvate/ketoisovalerate oxidoreductase catalytic domain-containing protein n=1 Tax=Candidatus Lokiarchaeum ossiferum TaxID=2951803 RepID=A0ABY6HY46_9ARCH|nr:hypothetical protein NEF87_004745 [Candidatus Lokiarchaeum sp. B-35]